MSFKILTAEEFKKIPSLKQTQVSLEDQLRDLRGVANRLGFYDAADIVGKLLK